MAAHKHRWQRWGSYHIPPPTVIRCDGKPTLGDILGFASEFMVDRCICGRLRVSAAKDSKGLVPRAQIMEGTTLPDALGEKRPIEYLDRTILN